MIKIILHVAFLIFFTGCTGGKLNDVLKQHKIYVQKDFDLIDHQDDPFIFLGKAKNENIFLKIKIYNAHDRKSAKQKMEQLITNSFSQFLFTPAAFPGNEKMAKECEDKFKPRLYDTPISYIIAYADQRFALCICQANSPFFKSATAFFYVEKSYSLVMVEYYSDVETSQEKINNFFVENFKDLENLKTEQFR